MLGQLFGGYRITRKIGEGGMGVVYEAEHVVLGRRVAIKCLLPHLSHDVASYARFLVEARAAARVSHPSLVDVFDSGHGPSGAVYIVMEYLEGEGLGSALRRHGPFDLASVIAICRQIANGVSALHERGVVHRDLKPDNVVLLDADRAGGRPLVKVIDFGVAKLMSADASQQAADAGVIVGTPMYMAPEQCRGADVDARADVYSLGCIIHELLAGDPPFAAGTYSEALAKHIYEPPPPLRTVAPSVPAGVEELVLAMLAKDPDDRVASMEDVVWRLDALTSSSSGDHAAPERCRARDVVPATLAGCPRPTPAILSALTVELRS